MSCKIPPMTALVYFDEGVCAQSADALVFQFKSTLSPEISVEKVNSHFLSMENWEGRTVVLAMGGGVCSTWEENLGEKGMKKIRDYVFNKGKFIGLCAGAYFVAAKSFFQLSGQEPKEKMRLVSLFPGKAIGPMVSSTNHLSLEAAQAIKVSFTIDGFVTSGHLYYQGGCSFVLSENDVDTTVLAHHQSQPVAIHAKAGTGDYFLCGLHPEFIWEEALMKVPLIGSLAKTLVAEESFRKSVWQEINKKLSLPVRV